MKEMLKLTTTGVAILSLLLTVGAPCALPAAAQEPDPPEEFTLSAPVAAASLHNPTFDNHDWYEFHLRYQRTYPPGAWVPDDDNNAGNNIPPSVLQDWRLWYARGTIPVETDPEKTYAQYDEAVQVRTYWDGKHIAGLYQVIYNTVPCRTYRFQMYAQSRPEGSDDTLVALQVGIDRAGWRPDSANDPAVGTFPATTVWGASNTTYKWTYGLLSVETEALGNAVTVFTYADANGGRSHRILWDTGSFAEVPRTSNLIDASQPLPAPGSGINNVSAVASFNSAVISWNTGAVSTLGQVLYRRVTSPPGAWQYSSLSNWNTAHQITLTGLQSGASYEYVVVAYGYIGGTCKAIVSDTRRFDLWVAVTSVTISGPTSGSLRNSYTFIATVSPANATLPITYTWQATDQAGVTRVSSSTSDQVSFTWNTVGLKEVSVTARNAGGTVSARHYINIIGDAYEPDDLCTQAKPISTDGLVQEHNFHSSTDEDWVRFDATAAGTAYLIEGLTPPGSDAHLYLELYSDCFTRLGGQYNEFSPDVRLPFTSTRSGGFYLRLRHAFPTQQLSNASYRLSVRSLDTLKAPGALILVAGKLQDSSPVQAHIHRATDAIYRFFLSRGYDGERIHYLATDPTLDPDGDGTPDVDAVPSRNNLYNAITSWATGYVDDDRPLVLYLVGHGGPDYFYLNGSTEQLRPSQLHYWLGALEALYNPGLEVNVVLDFPQAGSFVDTLGKPGRVVVASTGAQQSAWAVSGDTLFSSYLFTSLSRGMSLGDSFERARRALESAQPAQTPWLDDDGDGVPNEETEGATARQRFFATRTSILSDVTKWPPSLVKAEVGKIVSGRGVITAEVRDDVGVARVWAAIYPPTYVLPPSGQEEMALDTVPTITLTIVRGNLYAAEYTGFSGTGIPMSRIVVYAVDGDGLKADPRVIWGGRVYLPMVTRR
ncbi:MAG: hypothetical protein N2508_15070 [Anaerolineae bacterium]|nr:hypothetical protein [Anaerolineae bacterium]